MTDAPFLTVEDITDPATVLVRADINSPVEDGIVKDNRRFSRHAETLRYLTERDHRVVVLAHQGRPGRPDYVSLTQHADILDSYLKPPVSFHPETTGSRVSAAIESLDPGTVLVLENVRMHADELADRTPAEHASGELVSFLSEQADVYVGDAYSTAHRDHATIVGLPTVMQRVYAGRVMEREFLANSAIQSRTFDGEVTMALGGTKADDLFRVIRGVTDKVDYFLLGGVIGELCLRALGYDLGYDVPGEDLYDDLWDDHQPTIEQLVEETADRLVLPVDMAAANGSGERIEIPVDGITKEQSYLDVGSDTVDTFATYVDRSEAVFVKGALGVFEDDRFATGTVGLLEAISSADVFSVVGGGDTSRAVDLYDLNPDAFDHISIAGGAYVRALAGESLPGVSVLKNHATPEGKT